MKSTVTPTARQRWYRSRGIVAIGALVVVVAVILAWAQSQYGRGYLDPTSVQPNGSRALAELLTYGGVDVHRADDDDAVVDRANATTTVLVTTPDVLDGDRLNALLGTGAELVFVDAFTTLEDVPASVTATSIDTDVVEPACELAEADRAGSVRVGGTGYVSTSETDTLCFPVDDAAALAVVTLDDGVTVTFLGSGDVLTNRYLDQDGNAALAMNLLGRNGDLVWFQPRPTADGDTAATDLLPAGLGPVVVLLGAAAVLAAVWRGRRMGRLVTEPLPVVVRASETAEGRGQLYRHSRDRAHSATVLRRAATDRLRQRLAAPRSASDQEVAAMVADQVGRPTADVAALLGGDPPADDQGLVALADDLDTLESHVRDRS